ncbi:stress responsive A/B barrel domain protein [Mycena maculata]|uniref:Stress responsive A/B barrel domain protein n=1 Tax=Mycena maculata TaxID=230809 RepID=A0AAD7JU45_9AGAR|nr:stress responsive A/B barrel domain protein [Mycena maculata]
MGILHVVMFAFEPLAAEVIQDVCDRMLGLKDNCVHPETNKPYIKMGMGGKEDSPEGRSGGITHVFISEFENEQDRQYYLKEDPAHLAFVNSLSGIVSKVQVVDFTPGVF